MINTKLISITGGSIKNPTRCQCVQDNGSQQPLGVRTSHFGIINDEMRNKIFSKKLKILKNPTVIIFKFE